MIPQTMRAASFPSFGAKLAVSQHPTPDPGPGQALVRVLATGVCHTDLHAVEGDWPVKPVPPLIPGHEGVGVVAAVGEGVTEVAVGDLVGNAWLWFACGGCEFCRTGRETLCETQVNGGYSVPGSFAEYMLVNARFAAVIPPGTNPVEVAPVLCSGVTVYKGLRMSGVLPGQWVAISGIGGLGHLAVQYAVAMGMRVVAIDIAEDKLALAKRHGAELVVNARHEDPAAAVRAATQGTHGVLVTAVHPSAFGQAIGMARKGGTIVFNGLPTADFPAPIFDIVVRALTIRGSIVGTRQDMVEAHELFTRGRIRPTVRVRPLEEVNEVFDDMRAGNIDGRVVLTMGEADEEGEADQSAEEAQEPTGAQETDETEKTEDAEETATD